MPSWERIRFEEGEDGSSVAPRPTDQNITMTDRTANVAWSDLVTTSDARNGFFVQNTSQVELRIRAKGSNVTGNRLPGYGDSYSPDFQPHGAYEIQADADNSTFVLTVW